MPKYRFVVVTAAGSRVEAESEADSVEKLRARLASRGCEIQKVQCIDGEAEALSSEEPSAPDAAQTAPVLRVAPPLKMAVVEASAPQAAAVEVAPPPSVVGAEAAPSLKVVAPSKKAVAIEAEPPSREVALQNVPPPKTAAIEAAPPSKGSAVQVAPPPKASSASKIAKSQPAAAGNARWPVFRQCAGQGPFGLNFGSEGVALYADAVVIFNGQRVDALPERVFASTRSEILKSVPKVKVQRFVPWRSVENLTVSRRGTGASFSAKVEGKKLIWQVPLREARDVVGACHQCLSERFESSLKSEDYEVKPSSKRGLKLLGIVLILAAAWGVFWKFYGQTLTRPAQAAAVPSRERKPETVTVDQALTRHAEVTFAGKAADAPYTLHLSPGWKSEFDPNGSSTFHFENDADVTFGVQVLRKSQDDPEPDIGAARSAFEALVYEKKEDDEDQRAWLQDQQAERPIIQKAAVSRDGRQRTAFEATDDPNQRTWRAEFTGGSGCGYLVFGSFPAADAGGKMRNLLDAAFRDVQLPPLAKEEEKKRAEARVAAYHEALHEPKAVTVAGKDPAYTVALGRGWRELPLTGEDRQFLMANNAALGFQVQVGVPLMSLADARQWFRVTIGGKDHPEWPITEANVAAADGKTWKEWRADTDEHGVHNHWRGRWCSDLEHSYLLSSRSWNQSPELDPLAAQLLDQAFANFARAPLHTNEYKGEARPYVFNLPGEWKPLDLSANGFDKAWEGPADMVVRVETGAGNFTPAHLPGLVAAARENFAKTYRLGPNAAAGHWVRFRADIDIAEKSYACFFSLTVTAEAYYMVSVVVPVANLERCEPVVAEIQDAIKLP